jgi:hypothetical protein
MLAQVQMACEHLMFLTIHYIYMASVMDIAHCHFSRQSVLETGSASLSKWQGGDVSTYLALLDRASLNQ